jgi:hypothetical protein
MANYISETNFINMSDFIFPGGVIDTDVQEFDVNKMFDGCIVYLCYTSVHYFVEQLQNVTHTFKVISGYSDYTVPNISDKSSDNISYNILSNEYLISWHAINIVDDSHPKLYHIPLGIPRHIPCLITDSEVPHMGYFIKVVNNDTSFLYNTFSGTILERMKSKTKSDKLLFATYTTDNSKGSNIAKNENFRHKLDTYLENNTSFNKVDLLPWDTYVNEMSKYKYIIEPHGRCLDGYRVWEALYVGTVPIVFRSSITVLHEDLPILIIDNFEDITEKNLEDSYETIINKCIKWEKLEFNYWKNLILATT